MKINFIATVFFISLSGGILSAQVDSHAVKRIDAYVKHIDSLAGTDYLQNRIVRSIVEGSISRERTVTPVKGDHNEDSTKIETGGWSRYTYHNIKGDTAFRIEYHDNLDKNFYLHFYFKDNQLIYAKLDYQEDGPGRTFYEKEEYYTDGNILAATESKGKIDVVYREQVSFSLFDRGNRYLRDFLNKQ